MNATVASQKELSDDLNPDEVALVLFITIVIFSIGFASTYLQCRKLVRVIRKSRQQQKAKLLRQANDDIDDDDDIRQVRNQLRIKHGKDKEQLVAELRDMKLVQQQVKAKLFGLEQLVETVARQHEILQEQHAEKMTKLKSVERKNNKVE